ncbi:MAG: FtsQ-type POTRA domain-containing protein [Gemmatimonadales bacterium]
MTRRGRLALAGLAAVVLTAPLWLRVVPFFQVRRVELIGVRYLAPERVLAALDLAERQALFASLRGAERRVRALPGVVTAQVERRVPATVRVTVVERQPVALVSGPAGMVALDCEARPMPYDPVATGLGLPLVAVADGRLTQALCVVRAADSTLYREVEIARRDGAQDVTLELADQRVRLRGVPTTDEILAVVTVRRHLAANGPAMRELDARYAGGVVARGRGT